VSLQSYGFVGSPIDLWFLIQSFGKNNHLFEFFHRQLSFICLDIAVVVEKTQIKQHAV